MSYNKSSPNYQPSRSSYTGDMSITGSLFISGSLFVSGSTYLSGSTTVSGSFAVSGSTYLSGSTTVYGPLSVTGSTILSGSSTTVVGPFTVSGSTILSGSSTIYGNFAVSGSTYLSGSTTITGSLSVTGSTILSGSSTTIIGPFAVSGSTILLSGSITIVGPMSGSSGSYVMGPTSVAQHAIAKFDSTRGDLLTGSNVIFADDGPYIYLSGSNQMMMGLPLSGSSGSWGIGTGYMAPTGSFVIYSSEMEGANRIAVRVYSNPMKTTIDDNMIITQFGWMSSGSSGVEATGSWNVKVESIESADLSAAEMLGSELDGGSSIGTILGTSASYSTAGSKLVSVQNNNVEREYIDYAGQKTYGISDYGSSISDYYFTELLAITGSTAGIYSSVAQVPAGALIQGVSVRVRNTFPTASVFSCGLSGSWVDWGASISGVQTVTNNTSSLSAGWKFVSVNSPIFLSCSVMQSNVSPSTNSGSVRIDCRYRVFSPLTS